jgi:type IV pilus assembly protein PilV
MPTQLRHRKQLGSTLIEVLVTMVLVAIGILTTLGMQINTKESLYDSVQRTTAAQLAHDMSERLRSNRDGRDSYVASGTVGGGTLTATTCTAASPCAPAAMAALDLYEWEQMLDGAAEAGTGGLVNPQGCITGPAAGGAGQYTVAIAWRGIKELSDPTSNNCGTGSGYGASDEFRRVLTFTLFLS